MDVTDTPALSAQEAAIAGHREVLHGTATERVLRLYDAIRGYGAPRVSLDRGLLFTESLKTTEGQPLVLRWARALKHFVEQVPVTIFPDELIVGRPNTWLGRWAIVYPNYEYGQSATATFKQQMIARQSGGLEFIEIAVPLGKIDAGPVTQAIADAKPDAIFSSLFGPDLARFVREGNTRGLFRDRPVFNLLGGEPEYLDPLKDEAPSGWWVTGYPWYAIDTPAHKAFRGAYEAKFADYPRLGSVVGYATIRAAAAAIRKAGSTEPAKIAAALRGLDVDTPFGRIVFRTLDQQSTMGAYVGRTAVRDGKGVMVDWRYADGRDHLPPDEIVRRLRPAR